MSNLRGYVEIQHEFVDGKRKNTKVLYLPTEKQLYHKNTTSKKLGTAYVCQEHDCKAHAYIREDGKCYQHIDTIHHHGFSDEKQERTSAISEMKSRAKNERTTPVRVIFDDVMSR